MNLHDYFDTATPTEVPCLVKQKHTIANGLVPFKNGSINADIALLGVCHDDNSLYNKGSKNAPDLVRSFLYNMNGLPQNMYLTDLGNLKKGMGLNDTYFALKDVVAYLLSQKVIPVVLGGSHDLTYAISEGIAEHFPKYNLAVLDSTIDALSDEDLDDHSFLAHIHKKNEAGNISVLGYQGYQSEAHDNFELLRLKTVRDDLSTAEPVFRDALFSSFDIAAVRASDAPACAYASPNGLHAEQACKLAHYAGLSDNAHAFGLFGIQPALDVNFASCQLGAQITWHFINGLDNRYKDYPLRDIETYSKKTVHQEDLKREIVFYHNIQNNRWWFNAGNEDNKYIVSCTMEDYFATRKGGLPDRIMRFLR